MNNKYRNTFSEELIAFLFSCKSHKMRRAILYEFAKKRFEMEKSVYNQNIYRLKKNGFLIQDEDVFFLSLKGVSYYTNPYRHIKEKIDKKNKIIIIFDIPENKRKVREWIRSQIKFWDFEMIQKSVWVGYGPLPSEFMSRLRMLGVYDGVRIFNVQSKNSTVTK
ncbi:MAG: hypothetical protein WC908_00240 [Candidatus Paceibacterota bacterium]